MNQGWVNAAIDFVDANLEAGRADKIAIQVAGTPQSLTYAEVASLVNRAGNGLLGLGLQVEQRAVILLPDGPDFVAAFFGAIKAGIVPVPANTLLQPGDYRFLLEDSRAQALIVAESLLDRVAPALDGLRHLRHVTVSVDGSGDSGEVARGRRSTWSRHGMAEILDSADTDLDPEPMSSDDPCFWLYSSGTTGFPKGAVHLQHDMGVCAEGYARGVLGLTAEDTTYSVAKLFFAYGLGNALYFPFAVGATTVLDSGRPTPEAVFRNLVDYDPTVFYSVPTNFGALLDVPRESAPDALRSLRCCVSAGEALPVAIYDDWLARYGVEILDSIGSTEVLHMFIANRPGAVRKGSSGKPVPGYDARLVDDRGDDVEVGEVGDLLIRGDSTCAYYWNRHEQTKATLLGDWIRTGDKYRIDEDGYYWYQGREDDMLKVGGIWVSPFEVESAVVRHPDVLEAAVVGMADAQGLVKPKAFVVLNAAARESHSGTLVQLGEAIQAFVKEGIAPFKYPRWIEFVDELPKTATGKIQRYRLRTSP